MPEAWETDRARSFAHPGQRQRGAPANVPWTAGRDMHSVADAGGENPQEKITSEPGLRQFQLHGGLALRAPEGFTLGCALDQGCSRP